MNASDYSLPIAETSSVLILPLSDEAQQLVIAPSGPATTDRSILRTSVADAVEPAKCYRSAIHTKTP